MAEADWLRLQKKIFGRYIEQRLKEGGIKYEVKDIVEEMKSGQLMIDLLEAMSGQKCKKQLKPAKMRIQQIENANTALDFVRDSGVDLSKIRATAEDVVDGKEKIVFALIFQIIVKYLKIDEGDEGKAIDIREALNLWLHNKTQGYKHVNIQDFTKSFHDGMAFLALVHRMRPKLIDYDARDPGMKESNLDLALELGAKYLNIPKYLSASDIRKLDEISMIVYLTDWYTGVTLLQKQDIAARRIGKLVDVTELHDKLRADYKTRATSVRDWLDATIVKLNERTFDDTLAGVKQLLEQFYAFKKIEKSAKVAENLDAVSIYDNLSARLINHKRPPFNPAGLTPADLETKFSELESAETKRSEALHAELARQIHLQKVFKRFNNNTEKLNKWSADKDAYVKADEKINSVEDAEDALDTLNLFEGECKHMQASALADLNKLGEELFRERFEKSSEVKATQEKLNSLFSSLSQGATAKRAKLDAALAAQKALNDSLYKAFAAAVTDFNGHIKGLRDALAADGKKSLEEQLAAAQGVSWGGAEGKIAAIQAADAKIQERELANNPYTNVTLGDVQSVLEGLKALYTKKVALLKEQIEDKKRGGLTPEQLKEIDENFRYFDKDSNGFLNKKELRTCLQSLGEESTPKDIARVFAEYDAEKKGRLTRADFERFMRASLGDTDTPDEIKKSFRYLSYDKDHILTAELNNVVNNRSFTDHHVKYLSGEMPAKGAGLDFEAWTAAVFAR